MINVLVVEDSRVIRDYLVYVLEADPELRVSAVAASGEEALASLDKQRPDVILMDLHLPGIDGFEATRQIMSTDPIPIVICTSSTNYDQVHTAMHALNAGALAVLKKPSGLGHPHAEAEAAAIITTLKLMAEIKLVKRWNRAPTAAAPSASSIIAYDPRSCDAAIVAIGASTGGPPALLEVLSGLPSTFPVPILIVQHIAAGFTAGLVAWLASVSRLPVHLALAGELPRPGHVYLAPDDQHLRVGLNGELETTRDGRHNGLRPSVGVLFRSVAEHFGPRAIGVLLTGMGRDGAEELKFMADRGALTIAQDEGSCVVFGMPAEAIKLGAARFVLSPRQIRELLNTTVTNRVSKGEINA